MKLSTILAVTAVSALAAPAAFAQSPPDPISGGTEVGGSVPSFLELIIAQPTANLATFTKAKTYSSAFDVSVTATDNSTVLSLADGDVTSGKKLGHLASGKKSLPLPLETRVGKTAFQPLDQTVDPQLFKWSDAATRAKQTVNLRQQVKGKAAGSYHKVLLVTLSTDTP
jgi:hypothetical protein